MVRSLVITGFGINCEEEMAAAFRLAGADADIVHLNDVFLERTVIHEYDILSFPGGFSFGDDLGAGKALANKIKYKRLTSGKRFYDEVQRFLGDGKHVLGICNGFQVLVKTGLLPDTAGELAQEVTLMPNDSGRFEDRWCTCRVSAGAQSPFLNGLGLVSLPVRHGEGKLVIRDERVTERILALGLNCLTYVDAEGRPALTYPDNPNGSSLACAGLSDRSGQILGMMPHPEAYLSLHNHPNWPRLRRDNPEIGEEGQGLALFQNIVDHVSRSR